MHGEITMLVTNKHMHLCAYTHTYMYFTNHDSKFVKQFTRTRHLTLFKIEE